MYALYLTMKAANGTLFEKMTQDRNIARSS